MLIFLATLSQTRTITEQIFSGPRGDTLKSSTQQKGGSQESAQGCPGRPRATRENSSLNTLFVGLKPWLRRVGCTVPPASLQPGSATNRSCLPVTQELRREVAPSHRKVTRGVEIPRSSHPTIAAVGCSATQVQTQNWVSKLSVSSMCQFAIESVSSRRFCKTKCSFGFKMSRVDWVALLYPALDVPGQGRQAPTPLRLAPEPLPPGWRDSQLVFVAAPSSLLALARSGSILGWQRLGATRVPIGHTS